MGPVCLPQMDIEGFVSYFHTESIVLNQKKMSGGQSLFSGIFFVDIKNIMNNWQIVIAICMAVVAVSWLFYVLNPETENKLMFTALVVFMLLNMSLWYKNSGEIGGRIRNVNW